MRLFDASSLLRCRMYEGAREVWNGFTRNAFEGLGSFKALIVMTSVLSILFLAPFFWLVFGLSIGAHWTALCIAQVITILAMRSIQAKRFGHWESVLLFPVSVGALIAIQWGSFWRSCLNEKIEWKGRVYGETATETTVTKQSHVP